MKIFKYILTIIMLLIVTNAEGTIFDNTGYFDVTIKVCDAVWDVNRDGKTNILDIIAIGQHFGETTTPPYPPYDVVGTGKVNILDIISVGQHFGQTTCWKP